MTGDIPPSIPPPEVPAARRRPAPEVAGELEGRRVKRQRGPDRDLLRKRSREEGPEAEEVTSLSSRRRVRRQAPFSELEIVKHLKGEFARLAREMPYSAEKWNKLAESLTSEADFEQAFEKEGWGWSKSYSPQLNKVASCMKRLQQQKAVGYFSSIDLLIRNVPSFNTFDNILLYIYMVTQSSEEWVELLSHAASLYSQIPQDRQLREALIILNVIPKAEMSAARAHIADLITQTNLDERQLLEVRNGLLHVPDAHKLEFLRELPRILRDIPPDTPIKWVIRIMGLLPQNKRAKLTPHVISLFRGKSESEQKDLWTLLNNISAETLPTVLPVAASFLQRYPVTKYFSHVVRAVALIPSKEQAYCLRWASQFYKRNMHGEQLYQIIKTISNLLPAERRNMPNILSCALGLVKDSDDFYSVPEVINTIAAIPQRERGDVAKQALPLLPFAKINRSILLNELFSIDRVEREEIVTQCLPLLRGVVSGYDVMCFLSALKSVPRLQRQQLLDALSARLLAIEAPGERALFLKAVARVTPEQREEFSQALQNVLQGLNEGKKEFLHSLNTLADDQKVAALTEAQPFLSGQSDGWDAGLILLEFNHLSREAKNYLAQHVELFRGSSDLMRSIAAIDPQPLEEIVTPLLPLLEGLQSGSDRALALRAIGRADPDQRAAMRTLLGNLLREAGDRTSEILGTIDSLTELERRHILSLPNVQDYASLQQALDQHRPYETPEGSPYRLHILPEVLENTPEQLLNQLAKEFIKEGTYLSVEYENQAGIDAGGLGRQFVSDLFANLIKKLDCKEIGHSGLYRSKLQPPNFAFPEAVKEIYHNIGRMMLFCLNATREYPTGVHFDQGTFVALLGFSDGLLQQDFDALDPKKPESFGELLGIFEKMNAQIESELQAVMHMKRYLAPLPANREDKKDFLETLYSIVEDEESIKALNIARGADLEHHLEQLQAALRNIIFQNVLRPNLAPLHEIARGMKSAPFANKLSWEKLHTLPPAQVSDLLQGVNSTKEIIDKLEMDAAIPEEKKQWLRNWINSTSDENRKRFLQALTGSRALGKRSLEVHYARGELAPIYFHSCFNSVDFPFDPITSESQFGKTLEAHLKDLTYNRA